MNIVIDNRLVSADGWRFVFSSLGHTAEMWHPERENPFDLFDRVKPHLFFGHCGGLTRGLVKNLEEQGVTSALYYERDDPRDEEGLGEQERDYLRRLLRETANGKLLRPFSFPEDLDELYTHPWDSLPHGGDIRNIVAKDELYDCDLAVFGELRSNPEGFSRSIFPNLMKPGCNTKIYGNGTWRVPNDVGFLPPEKLGVAMASATSVAVPSVDVCRELPYLFFQALMASAWVGTDSLDFEWLGIAKEMFRLDVNQQLEGFTWFAAANEREFCLKNHTLFARYVTLSQILREWELPFVDEEEVDQTLETLLAGQALTTL